MSAKHVNSVGNYLMTGKVLGKGHFARVEEATHRIIGKKVAVKIIDLTSIKEEYARRNLHREPRVMAKLQHPCIAALYETMMHGPRLFVVMEAAGGGDLCSLVLAARGASRGLPEPRAKCLAAQLVSAVQHMHARGVVHRDLKMENIMLDTTKQFIKIVDFGLSNTWCAGGALRTPCGSLEYAAPELFVDGHKYGPEVDLWSIGVIVYGMVTGGLPFTGPNPEGGSRGQLRAAITKGFGRKQRAALAPFTTECRTFIQHLLEPKVEGRMRIEEAARHRWVKRPGMRMKTHPFATLDPKFNRELYRQIAELCGMTFMDVVSKIKSEPFGSTAGIYNIKLHLHNLHTAPGTDLLWSSVIQEPRPVTPPEYTGKYEVKETRISSVLEIPKRVKPIEPKVMESRPIRTVNGAHILDSKPVSAVNGQGLDSRIERTVNGTHILDSKPTNIVNRPHVLDSRSAKTINGAPIVDSKPTRTVNGTHILDSKPVKTLTEILESRKTINGVQIAKPAKTLTQILEARAAKAINGVQIPVKPDAKVLSLRKPSRFGILGLKKIGKFEYGDSLEARLPSIEEHSNIDDVKRLRRQKTSCVRKVSLEEPLRLNSCPNRLDKRIDFYKRAGDGLPRNIVSPHSSTNSHCKSEKATPVGWHSSRVVKETHLQRLRRMAPMK